MAKKNTKKGKLAKKAVPRKSHAKAGKKAKKGANRIKHVKITRVLSRRAIKTDADDSAMLNSLNVSRLNEMIQNTAFSGFITSNVGPEAMQVISTLAGGPETDEKLAERLNMKINDVRRMLNVMNGHSILRYDVTKDGKGWLIFKWRIDSEKLGEFIYGLTTAQQNAGAALLPNNCNDFFFCKSCFPKEKAILPFDTAFENTFKCDCGKKLEVLNRSEAEELFKQATTQAN